jgi:hypothetical protein
MTGHGEGYLSAITRDVGLWNRWSPALPDLEQIAEETDERAEQITQGVLRRWLAGESSDIRAEAARLEELGVNHLAESVLASAGLNKVKRLKNGTRFGEGERQARVTVKEPGVRRATSFVEELLGFDFLVRGGEVSPGTVLRGAIRSFTSSPEEGGLLTLRHGFAGWLLSDIQGLVDPSDGHHRVQLDILGQY